MMPGLLRHTRTVPMAAMHGVCILSGLHSVASRHCAAAALCLRPREARGHCLRGELAGASAAASSLARRAPSQARRGGGQTLLGAGASVVLEGQRVLPKRAADAGFRFQFSHVGPALASIFR